MEHMTFDVVASDITDTTLLQHLRVMPSGWNPEDITVLKRLLHGSLVTFANLMEYLTAMRNNFSAAK